MNTTAIERFVAAIRTRRALLGAGIAALGLAFAGDDEREAGARKNRQRHRKRRNRRQRRRGGGPRGGVECFVCEDLDDNPNCLYTSIQAALEAAGDGEVIAVCPGTFKERLNVSSTVASNVTVVGSGPQETTLDADGDGTAVTIARGNSITIQDVTITGGKATAGGGVVNRGLLTLSDCVITENESEGSPGGGGIYNDGGHLTLTLTEVMDNEADGGGQGGGIFNGAGGTVAVDGASRVTDNKPNNCVGTTACGA